MSMSVIEDEFTFPIIDGVSVCVCFLLKSEEIGIRGSNVGVLKFVWQN
jgi:hypothetical protein